MKSVIHNIVVHLFLEMSRLAMKWYQGNVVHLFLEMSRLQVFNDFSCMGSPVNSRPLLWPGLYT